MPARSRLSGGDCCRPMSEVFLAASSTRGRCSATGASPSSSPSRLFPAASPMLGDIGLRHWHRQLPGVDVSRRHQQCRHDHGGHGRHFDQQMSMFSGGIANSGTISGHGNGIKVSSVTQFGSTSTAGGISNSGAILARTDNGIDVTGVLTFFGSITNSGTISGGNIGLGVGNVGQFSFEHQQFRHDRGRQYRHLCHRRRSIRFERRRRHHNSGTVSGGNIGVGVYGVSIFFGGISNSGTVSAGSAILVNTTFDLLRRHQQQRHDIGALYRHLRLSDFNFFRRHQQCRHHRGDHGRRERPQRLGLFRQYQQLRHDRGQHRWHCPSHSLDLSPAHRQFGHDFGCRQRHLCHFNCGLLRRHQQQRHDLLRQRRFWQRYNRRPCLGLRRRHRQFRHDLGPRQRHQGQQRHSIWLCQHGRRHQQFRRHFGEH